jgi:hypothetical protein
LGLKGSAYSVAILEYSVAHDVLLQLPTLSIKAGSEAGSIRPTPKRDRKELWGDAEAVFERRLPTQMA